MARDPVVARGEPADCPVLGVRPGGCLAGRAVVVVSRAAAAPALWVVADLLALQVSVPRAPRALLGVGMSPPPEPLPPRPALVVLPVWPPVCPPSALPWRPWPLWGG